MSSCPETRACKWRKTMKKSVVYCCDSNVKGLIDFYVRTGNESIYLFTQKYRKSTFSHYRNGLILDEALSYRKAYHDHAIISVIKRVRMNICYIEKQHGIAILNKTQYALNPLRKSRVAQSVSISY